VAKKKREDKPKEYTRRQLSHFQKQKRRQRIIFISGVGIIAAVLLIVLFGWYLGEYRPVHRTVIKVNETRFNTGYYVDMLKLFGSSQDMNTLTTTLTNNIIEGALVRQEAEKLGIVVNDDEVRKDLEEAGSPTTDVYVDIIRTQKLQERLSEEYFGIQLPVSANQVYMMAMLAESESVADEVRAKVINGDNFTALARQYGQNYYSKNEPYGDFGWHPAEVFQGRFDTLVPVDYAFGAAAGDVSPPLSDNASYKQLGYWLIKVLSMSEDEEGQVQALLLSSLDEAVDIKARLESGDNLTALAAQYSQFSTSRENGGELGTISRPSSANDTAISVAFDGYVFNPGTELGKWSDPVKDTEYWTQGGAWVVKVVDKADDRELSSEDRTILINKAYSEWVEQLPLVHAAEIDISGLTEEVRVWMISRAQEELQQAVGG